MKISPAAYTFQRPFLRGLFFEVPIFGGAYVQREIWDWASLLWKGNLPFLLCVTLYSRANSEYKPSAGAYIRRGDLTEGFLRGGGEAYIWRGLYKEGLILGILRYLLWRTAKFHPWRSALYFLLRSLLRLACLFVYFNGPPSLSLIFFNKQKYLLFREQISANDSSPVTILEAATGPGIRSRRSMSVAQQSTKQQICNTTEHQWRCVS